jgi:hypothetical protein
MVVDGIPENRIFEEIEKRTWIVGPGNYIE